MLILGAFTVAGLSWGGGGVAIGSDVWGRGPVA